MNFFSSLENRVREVDSLLCVGLDPHPQDLDRPTPDAARSFCLNLIAETHESAAAYKPNMAFFEAFGPPGIEVLQEVIQSVPDGIPVILDAKRGDIASTAEAYAVAIFETLGADAVTLNPYLGYDAIAPFLSDPAKGVFLLCKTSNPGARDLQSMILSGGQALYEHVAQLAEDWNREGNLGLVVGATHPESLKRVRAVSPHLWILAPGIGAQGGDLSRALQAGLRPDGLGILVPVARGIARSGQPAEAAQELRQAINLERRNLQNHSAEIETTVSMDLAGDLLEFGCVQFGQFTLKSGMQSPIYIDLRRLISHPQLLARVAAAYLPTLRQLVFDRLAAIPYSAVPIATTIGLQTGRPLVYPRKETKTYGTKVQVEGQFNPGELVVVIDDLTTTGESKFEVIDKLRQVGLRVHDVVVLIDRQSGAQERLAQSGYRLHAVFTLSQLLDYWEHTGKVPEDQISAVRRFLASNP